MIILEEAASVWRLLVCDNSHLRCPFVALFGHGAMSDLGPFMRSKADCRRTGSPKIKRMPAATADTGDTNETNPCHDTDLRRAQRVADALAGERMVDLIQQGYQLVATEPYLSFEACEFDNAIPVGKLIFKCRTYEYVYHYARRKC
jgi:hypothetical protein